MFLLRLLTLLVIISGHLSALHGQDRQAAQPTEKLVYKTIGEQKLELWVWKPADWKATDKRSAVVFYHGGGWRKGSPVAFSRQSKKLAELGMVAISVQYRLTEQPGVTIKECIIDARSAFRWVRCHAAELGIDPEKIATGGGSAGGHLAAALTTIELNDEKDDLTVSTRPAALLLFNPAANLDFQRAQQVSGEGLKAKLLEVSPYHHLKDGHPPVIIFHGEEDKTVPISSVRIYADKIKELGGQCELVAFPGQGHGFFNKDPHYTETLDLSVKFLQKQNLLPNSAP